jgi:calmodulin
VRAGGRLFAESPIAGFTKEEMLHEAKVRQEHNRQRAKLKQLLQATAGTGQTVSIDDLMLSAKIAKMSLPDELLFKSPYANRYTASRTEAGAPKDIRWRSFHNSIAYPKLTSEQERMTRRALRPQSAAAVVTEKVEEVKKVEEVRGPSDAEIRRAGRILRNHMETRFTQIRKAFRTMDEDASGTVTRKEMKGILLAFNLNLAEDVITALIDIADFDGDGNINYAEFARLMTADDIMSINPNYRRDAAPKPKKEQFRLYPGGPTADDLRKAQVQLRERINTKYTYLTDAFRKIDEDHSGRLGKPELQTLCYELNMHLEDNIIEGLLSLADHDGGGDISYAEFARILTADDVMNMKNTTQAVAH